MMFVVGDIHGEISKLKKLIESILAIDRQPSFVFIGDYIDKGENPKSVIEYLMKFGERFSCVFLMGNHEYFWINLKPDDEETKNYLLKYGGDQTIKSFNCRNIMETQKRIINDYFSFFNNLIPYHVYKNYMIVHSGISPTYFKSLPKQIPIKEFLLNRYDFISNESFYLNEYKTIFGHTGFFSPYYDGYKIGIDTAACFLQTQPLTAFNADKNYFINSDNIRYNIKSIDISMCPNIIRTKPWRSLK